MRLLPVMLLLTTAAHGLNAQTNHNTVSAGISQAIKNLYTDGCAVIGDVVATGRYTLDNNLLTGDTYAVEVRCKQWSAVQTVDIHMSWTPPTLCTDDTPVDLAGYILTINGDTVTADALATSHTFSGMSSGDYTLTIKAVDTITGDSDIITAYVEQSQL